MQAAALKPGVFFFCSGGQDELLTVVSFTRREVDVCEVTLQADVAVEVFAVGLAIPSKGHKRQKGSPTVGGADRSWRPSVAEPTVPTAEADRTIYLGHSMISIGALLAPKSPQ